MDKITLHHQYHPGTGLVCHECLVSLDGLTCPKCGEVYDICPECYRQVSPGGRHRCVLTARQRTERGISDPIYGSLGGSDDYL